MITIKNQKLISALLIICLSLTLFSCAKKYEDEEDVSVNDVIIENDVSVQTENPEKEQNTDTPKEDTKAPEKEEQKPVEDKKEEQEPESEPEPDNSQSESNTPAQTPSTQTPAEEPEVQKTYRNAKDIIFGDSATLICYSGGLSYTAIFEGKDEAFYKSYLTELKKDGFGKYTETSFNTSDNAKKNLFATYRKEGYIVDVDYHSDAKRLYATYTPEEDNLVLPALNKPGYKSCGLPTIVTQVGGEKFHKDANSMCYIIRAADGSFIVYDSDFGDGFAELIYNILKKQAPDPNNIVISAWFVTHPHLDHVGAFLDFADKYAGDKTITLKQMVYNYPSDSYIGTTSEELIRKTPIAAKKLNPDVTFVRPHAGNVLYYADLTFRVLYTQEQYLYISGGKVQDANASSVVTQMETDSGVKVFFGADHCVNGSYNGLPFCEGALYNWYGDFIKSDVVTLFHHGWGGGADNVIYSYIKPQIALWPANIYRLTRDADGTPYGSSMEFNERNLYFSDPERAKQNGVKGYYISSERIHIVDLSNKNLNVTEYKTSDIYLKSK